MVSAAVSPGQDVDEHGPLAKLSSDEQSKADAKLGRECFAAYFTDVDYEYRLAHTLTGAAREAEMKLLIECLETKAGVTGVEVSDDRIAVAEKISEQVAYDEAARMAASRCRDAHMLVFPPPDPHAPLRK